MLRSGAAGSLTAALTRKFRPSALRQTTQASTLVELDGGRFSMGAEDAEGFLEDGEGPVREVELSPFAIEAHAVTNRRFADFVDATGYMTTPSATAGRLCSGACCPTAFPRRAASSTHRGGGRSSVHLGAVPRARNP